MSASDAPEPRSERPDAGPPPDAGAEPELAPRPDDVPGRQRAGWGSAGEPAQDRRAGDRRQGDRRQGARRADDRWQIASSQYPAAPPSAVRGAGVGLTGAGEEGATGAGRLLAVLLLLIVAFAAGVGVNEASSSAPPPVAVVTTPPPASAAIPPQSSRPSAAPSGPSAAPSGPSAASPSPSGATASQPAPAATPKPTPGPTIGPGATVPPGAPANIGLLWEALKVIDEHWVRRGDLNPTDETYGMIDGLVDSLGDPGHSVFLTPEQVKSENDALSGKITGIGVFLGNDGGAPIVQSVVSGSPAARAGIVPGDRIIAIDGTNVENASTEEIARLVRGPAGTPVTLTVIHPGEDAPVDVTITRQTITVPAVSWAMVPGTSIADIRISQFSSGTGDQFVSALRGARQAGATGVVLDLRNNPGGYVDEAVNVASQFLKEGDVYVRRTADGTEIPVAVKEGGIAADLPISVLVDYGSASSAEITAGALQDAKRGQLFGTRTFGTGTVLNTFGLSDGSAIRLGVEEWLTPSRRAIFPNGILPDQEVNLMLGARPLEPDDIRSLTPEEFRASQDQQLISAVEALPEPMTDASLTVSPVGPVTAADRERRVARLQSELAKAGLDGAFYTERANFEYLSGVSLPPLWSSFTRLLAVVVPATGVPSLVMPSFVANEAESTGWRIETYDTLERGAADLLAGALSSVGLAGGRIGFERGRESRLAATFGELANLAERLPGATLDDGMAPMWATRSVKDAAEIARLRVACRAAGAGFAAAFASPREGVSERDVATIIETEGVAGVAGSGAWVQLGWIGITSGAGSYDRFVAGPRARRLERGDMLWADLGFTADGYWSDFCRAGIVGGPTQQQTDRQLRIAEATAVGTEMARPGVATADIARAMRAALARLGLPGLGFGRLGHGIGLTATEPPSIVEHDPTILEAGQVITCEPAAVLGDGLYCTEQIVVVGETPDVLSVYPTGLASI